MQVSKAIGNLPLSDRAVLSKEYLCFNRVNIIIVQSICLRSLEMIIRRVPTFSV